MRAVSLFSGVGGFELGLERAGIQTVLQAESDAWCLSVLERHWPMTERSGDVRRVDAALLQQLGDDQQRRRGGGVPDGDGAQPGLDGRLRDAPGRDADQRADGSNGEHARRESAHGLRQRTGAGRREAGTGLSSSIDLIYGGFPCQDLSVAGKRAGLRGERSGLWHEFHRVLRELRPRWALIENVPGLLSSNGGADFGVILRGLGDLGYGWAYRVLDARWFGVPQRRRRLFIVGCLGDAARAAQVLAVCESCGGHPQARRETRQDVAYAVNASVRGTGDGHGNAWNSNYVADEIAPTLDDGQRRASIELPMIAGSIRDEASARPLVARASGYRMDLESETFVVSTFQQLSLSGKGTFGWDENADVAKPAKTQQDGQMIVVADLRNGTTDEDTSMSVQGGGMGDGRGRSINSIPHVVANPVRASDGHHGWSGPRGDGGDNLVAGFYAHRGQANDTAYTEDASPPIVGGRAPGVIDVADPISAHEGKTWTHEGSNNFRTHNLVEATAFHTAGYGASEGHEASTLQASDSRLSNQVSGVFSSAGVRRLTPRECERLQGWPDDHTRWTVDGRQIPDSHRYRMIGNGVVATVAEWLGHRLMWSHQL